MNPVQMLYGSVVTCHGKAVQKVYLAEQFLNGDVTAPPHLRPNLPLVFPGFCLPIYQAAKFLSQFGRNYFYSLPHLKTKTYSSRMMKTNTRQAHIHTSSNVKHQHQQHLSFSQPDGSLALLRMMRFQ